jgi:hypothetical protein
MDYTVLIPVGPNDVAFFKENFEITRKNISSEIVIITKDLVEIEGCKILTEDKFPFSIKDFEKFGDRAGWYFQQLLKIYAPIILNLDNFVIIDADTIILKQIDFFKDNKINFNFGSEYHNPYFQHMKKVFGLDKQVNVSGICHLMPMKKFIVEDLISKVELLHQKTFWKVMIDNVDVKDYYGSGMSEYEMLFNFTIKYHPSHFTINPLKWRNLNNKNQITNDLDYASIHWFMR